MLRANGAPDTFQSAHDHSKSILVLELTQQEDKLWGMLTESNPDGSNAHTRVIFDGKIAGETVSFYTQSQVADGDAAHPVPYKEFYLGSFNKSMGVISFKRVDDVRGGSETERFIARRVQ